VLELGCGYGDFIGNISAAQKTAVETDENYRPYIEAYGGIDIRFGDSIKELKKMEGNKYNVVFCSNYFEHFTIGAVRRQLKMILKILTKDGKLIVLQPNFSLCSTHYFDDWTHKTAFSDISFSDLLSDSGFNVDKCIKGFMPFSIKSRLPVMRAIVRAYLWSSVKPLAAQFLIVASATGGANHDGANHDGDNHEGVNN
jgi:SAM-dependent methyltransferase